MLYPPDLASRTDLYIQTDPIDVVDVQQAVFLAVGGSGMAVGAGTMLYGGDLSAITDMTGLDPGLTAAVEAVLGEAPTRIDLIEFFDSTAAPPEVVGVLASYHIIHAIDPGTPVVLLKADTLEVMSSSTIIPEPGMFGLLGLGILCLGKRGKRS